jgi:hypothetical protein
LLTIGIEITNNSSEEKNVSFLGFNDNIPEGICIRNIFGDTLYDDGNLIQLKNMILASPFFVKGIRFTFTDVFSVCLKSFIFTNSNSLGGINELIINLFQYISPSNCNSIISIPDMRFVLDGTVTLTQTKIQPSETVLLIMNSESDMNNRFNSIVLDFESKLTEERKRNYLFLQT